MAITYTTATRNARADATTALVNGGSLVLQTSGGVACATLPLNATAFGVASAGVAALATSPAVQDTNAAGGTATIAVFKSSSGVEQFRGTCGTSGADIVLDNNVIPSGATVTVAVGSYTEPAS